MAVVSLSTGNQAAVINTEHSLYQVSGVGIYMLEVDVSALVFGDTLEIHVKTTCRTSDTLQDAWVETLVGTQVNKNWHLIVTGKQIGRAHV